RGLAHRQEAVPRPFARACRAHVVNGAPVRRAPRLCAMPGGQPFLSAMPARCDHAFTSLDNFRRPASSATRRCVADDTWITPRRAIRRQEHVRASAEDVSNISFDARVDETLV